MKIPGLSQNNSKIETLKNKISFLEGRLKSQNELLNFILGYSSICYIITDFEGQIRQINSQFTQLTDYGLNELQNKNILDFISIDKKKQVKLEELISNKLNSKEIKFKKKNNESINGYISGFKKEDDNHQETKVYFVFEPFNFAQISQTELEYERSLLQVLMDNIPDTIYFKDKHSKFTRINKAQAKLIGVEKPEEAIGKNDFDFFTKEHAENAYNDEKKIINTGEPIINKEEKLIFNDRPTKWVSTSKVGIKDNIRGEIDQIVGITRDITEKKNAEENLKIAFQKAKEADRLKSAFLANMSHEIRTPLNAILGFAGLLNDKKLSDEKRKKFIKIITSSGNMLLDLINDIIDIAKIEAGQLKILTKPFELNSFLKEIFLIYDEQRKQDDKFNFEFKLNIPLEEEKIIDTDSSRLRQIISNLIGNAFKFTQKGLIEFGYKFEAVAQEFQFYVKDTGIGIPENKINLIFERFGQIIENKEYADKGTGLGLAISKGLVQLLGGKIWVETKINKGSTFYFTLPTSFSTVDLDRSKNFDINVNKIDWSQKRLLIVEDDINSADYLMEVLYKTNLNIEHIDNGKGALKKLKNENFNIVLLDIKLNDIDGYEVFRQLRKLNKDIPVIAQTAYAMNEEEEKTLNFGFNGYLSKPLQIKELLIMLNKFL